jgi:uncharacterized protein (UPF0332 family)
MNEQQRKELVKHRIDKANETFNEVALHIEHELWATAVNRLYYACYYAVSALLINNEIQAQTHSGVRQMLGLHFIKTGLIDEESGSFYSYLFNMRQTGDYDDFVNFKKENIIDLVKPAGELILAIEKML